MNFKIFFAVWIASCQTWNDDGEPPIIDESTSVREAVDIAVSFGGARMPQAKALLKRKKAWAEAGSHLDDQFTSSPPSLSPKEVVRATEIYQLVPGPLNIEVLSSLLNSSRPVHRQVGWYLAAIKPSPKVATTIEDVLTKAIQLNREEAVLSPELADALRTNNLKSAYTFARAGLMRDGGESYAHAMLHLRPQQATSDFLRYLALAPPEELRQLSFSTVNVYTCLIVLRHMENFPPQVVDQKFAHLFYYAISRNMAISDLAHGVLAARMPVFREHLAAELARKPEWVQIAFLERLRRALTPVASLFLESLRDITVQKDVVAEINQIIR